MCIKKVDKEVYEIKYSRIKKPKKDEIIIFNVKNSSIGFIEHFNDMLIRQDKDNSKYITVTGTDLDIIKCKKKQVKLKCKTKNMKE